MTANLEAIAVVDRIVALIGGLATRPVFGIRPDPWIIPFGLRDEWLDLDAELEHYSRTLGVPLPPVGLGGSTKQAGFTALAIYNRGDCGVVICRDEYLSRMRRLRASFERLSKSPTELADQLPDGMLTHRELAGALKLEGKAVERLRGRLVRWSDDNRGLIDERTDGKVEYPVREVRPILRKFLLDESSKERTAEKKSAR